MIVFFCCEKMFGFYLKIRTITFVSKWEIRIERHTHNHKNIPSQLSTVTIKYPRSMVNSHPNELFGPIRMSHL